MLCRLVFHVKPNSTYGFRSNKITLLLPPTQKMLPTLGARSFAVAAPAARWNKLFAGGRGIPLYRLYRYVRP